MHRLVQRVFGSCAAGSPAASRLTRVSRCCVAEVGEIFLQSARIVIALVGQQG